MAVLTVEQVRALFAQEADVRLANLGQLLLALEQADTDGVTIGSIFRELHTIKGSSAVAGLPEVSTFAHGLEELVDDLRAGRATATPAVIDTLLAGVDGLAELITRSTGDSPSAEPADSSTTPTAQPPARPARVAATTPVTPPTPAQLPLPSARGAGGGVVMVPLERLDELSRLVSESASAHLRVGRVLSDRFGTDPASVAEFNVLSRALNDLQDRAMRTQMVAVATITDTLHRVVRDLARAQGKDIRWDTRGTDTELDRGVLLGCRTRCCTWCATPSTTASRRRPNARQPESRLRPPSGSTPCSSGRR